MLKPFEMFHVRQQGNAKINVASEYGLFDLGTVGVAQVQLDVGVRCTKPSHQFRQEIAKQGVRGGNPHRAAQIVRAKRRLVSKDA